MSETRNLQIKFSDGSTRECSVSIAESPPWNLSVAGADLGPWQFDRPDLFEGLIAFREELEKIGARLLCAGARPEVYPSGMSRNMGGGRKAYIHPLGASATEMVDIFDFAPPESVGTVAEQRAFRDRWIQSLRENIDKRTR
jgi:hypothetical protein